MVHMPGNLGAWHIIHIFYVLIALIRADKGVELRKEEVGDHYLVKPVLQQVGNLKKRDDPLMNLVVNQLKLVLQTLKTFSTNLTPPNTKTKKTQKKTK